MRAFVLVLISLALLFFEPYFNHYKSLRSGVSFALSPIQEIVNFPVKLTKSVLEIFSSKKIIMNENSQLNSELMLIKAKLQRLEFLEYENAQLQGLLGVSSEVKSKVLIAQLMKSVIDNSNQLITLNRGKKDKVYIGQPVIDAYGLVGQVISVEYAQSKVMLTTNNKSAIPVMVPRNGLHSVVIGKGGGNYLELINVPETSDLKVGDSLVTSDLGGDFIVGYPLGVVKEVRHLVGDRFMKVTIEPKARIGKSEHVLLVWPKKIGRGI